MTSSKTVANFLIILCFTLVSCEIQNKKENNIQSNETIEKSINEPIYIYEGDPLQVAVIGLIHDHVHWILGREDFGDIEIVGIVEPNGELAKRYSNRYGYSMGMVFKPWMK